MKMHRLRTVRRPRRPEGRIRRNPRAEKLGVNLLATAEVFGPTGRPRKDPRALFQAPINPATGRRRATRGAASGSAGRRRSQAAARGTVPGGVSRRGGGAARAGGQRFLRCLISAAGCG